MRQEPEAGVQGDMIACVKKIGECEAEIAKCEKKINDVETELMKEGISAYNLAFLRDKEMQYLKEKELLLTKSLANGARV